MAKYIVKRVILAIITLFLICFITFFLMNAIPGGPFNGEKAKSEAVLAALNAKYGLDKPVGIQFINYMKNLLHGDFGVSLKTQRDIATTIRESFKVSAKIGGIAIIVALICGIVLGAVAALNRNKWPDHVIIFFVTLFTAMPSFVAASFLLLIFCIQLQWVPVWSTEHPSYVLPVIALSLSPMAYITRLTKTSMLDVLGQDYIRTARAKGVRPIKVIFVHALRNALIPVITYVGPLTASILTGSLVVEKIFTIGGLGSKFVDSITNRDYPMIMGTTIFLAFIMVLMNLLSDLVYKLVDPRIQLD
ncbi:MAG: ABC transporter permease [Lachnospiraceae bacterium]|jgi:oligopeptide transport system permease protein|nr:ABC transporter permease [Lachnospiraceae bacterium]MCI1398275.1 ABC transporter permease [Lachnospiraceae bacterium]MCI1424521.1 ABC transporter permease [Lachnospiraceae bacterium]MCI1453274.1 ABC transporter permease [Lachnospiraceae bacterium]MDD5848320.1 ABC transporter permease [Bacillota bacterium]